MTCDFPLHLITNLFSSMISDHSKATPLVYDAIRVLESKSLVVVDCLVFASADVMTSNTNIIHTPTNTSGRMHANRRIYMFDDLRIFIVVVIIISNPTSVNLCVLVLIILCLVPVDG